MRKKLLVVLLVLVAVMMFAFANGQDENKKEELSIWTGYPEMEPFYQHVAEQFNETHPNVKITIVSHPLREFEQKLSATIPADTVGDIIEISTYSVKKFIDAGMIPENPDNVVDFMTTPDRFSDFVLSACHYGDKYYGLPLFLGRTALFYNKDMFKAAGIENPPTTFDEMYEDAKKLAKYDDNNKLTVSGHSLRLSGSGSGLGEKFWFVLFPMGGTILEEGATEGTYHAGYNNDAGFNAVRYYLDAVHKDKWDSPEIKHDAEAFELGLTAMFFRESWVIGDAAQKVPDLNYGTAFVPSAARWGRITNIENLYVTRACENPELAWEFAELCLSPENQTWMLDNIGWLPSRTDVDFSESIAKTPQLAAFIDSPEGYDEFGYIPISCFDEILTKFSERLSAAYLNAKLDTDDAALRKWLDDAAKETNEILEKAGMFGE